MKLLRATLVCVTVATTLLVVSPQVAQAHAVCLHATAYAARYDSRHVDINGHAWVTDCSTGAAAYVDDSWWECWPVHRHHWGITWWWHSHNSTGARHTGRVSSVWWGWQRHSFPDSRGVKTHCQFDGYHGNWATKTAESSAV
jgi:hypothetical protein